MGRPPKVELDEILDSATHLFWSQGCDDVSTRDLERALGIRAPAIYRRFESKERLLVRCLDHYVDNVIAERIRIKLTHADDPATGLYEFFVSALEPRGRTRKPRGCLLANTATSADGQTPEVHAALTRGWDLIDLAFCEQIERAQATGRIDPELKSKAVSQSLLMFLQGLLTLVKVDVADLRPGLDATFQILDLRGASREQLAAPWTTKERM